MSVMSVVCWGGGGDWSGETLVVSAVASSGPVSARERRQGDLAGERWAGLPIYQASKPQSLKASVFNQSLMNKIVEVWAQQSVTSTSSHVLFRVLVLRGSWCWRCPAGWSWWCWPPPWSRPRRRSRWSLRWRLPVCGTPRSIQSVWGTVTVIASQKRQGSIIIFQI